MLALAVAGVVDRPGLGALVARIPLPELVADGEDALLGPGTLLVAARAADGRIEAVLGDGVEEGHRLEAVARRPRSGLLDHAALVDRLLDAGHDEALAELGQAPVAVLEGLGEVVPGVDVHDRERETGRSEGLLRQAQQDDRVLAAREEEDRRAGLGGDLAHDGHGLRLERVEVAQQVSACLHHPRRGMGRSSGILGARS